MVDGPGVLMTFDPEPWVSFESESLGSLASSAASAFSATAFSASAVSFRRWHREKVNSGGLLIHKASHPFDLVNWWIDAAPRRVYASGGLRFYGSANANARGLGPRPHRGTHDGPTDRFQLDLRSETLLAELYLDAEAADGYLRDRDVFTDGITIEDTLSLVVDHRGGATMSYSLVPYSRWEGYRVSMTGTESRARLEVVERSAVLADGSGAIDPSFAPDAGSQSGARPAGESLVVQRHWEVAREIEIRTAKGSHGGGDAGQLADVVVG